MLRLRTPAEAPAGRRVQVVRDVVGAQPREEHRGRGRPVPPGGHRRHQRLKKAAVPACGLIAGLGLVSAYCFAPWAALRRTGTTTYRGAWESAVDKDSGALITSITTFKTLVGCIAYCIVVGTRRGRSCRARPCPSF